MMRSPNWVVALLALLSSSCGSSSITPVSASEDTTCEQQGMWVASNDINTWQPAVHRFFYDCTDVLTEVTFAYDLPQRVASGVAVCREPGVWGGGALTTPGWKDMGFRLEWKANGAHRFVHIQDVGEMATYERCYEECDDIVRDWMRIAEPCE